MIKVGRREYDYEGRMMRTGKRKHEKIRMMKTGR